MCVRLNNLIQIKELHEYFIQKFKIQMQELYQIFVSSKRVASSQGLINASGISFNNFKKSLKAIIYEHNLENKRLKNKINQILYGLTNLFIYRVSIRFVYYWHEFF